MADQEFEVFNIKSKLKIGKRIAISKTNQQKNQVVGSFAASKSKLASMPLSFYSKQANFLFNIYKYHFFITHF